jgi:hypothetical protein
MNRATLFTRTAVLVATTAALVGCSQEKTITQTAVIERNATKQFPAIFGRDGQVIARYGDFEVANFGERTRYHRELLTGTVKNTSEKPYHYTQITVKGLDEDEKVVETIVANHAGLGPHKTWKFSLKPINPDAIRTYKVESIAGW